MNALKRLLDEEEKKRMMREAEEVLKNFPRAKDIVNATPSNKPASPPRKPPVSIGVRG